MNETPYLRLAVNALLLFYLSTVNLVPHSGSTISMILACTGTLLFVFVGAKFNVTFSEKAVFIAFLIFPATYLLSFAINNWPDHFKIKNYKHLEDEFRMLLLFPLYFLFRKVKPSHNSIWTGILAGAIISGVYAIVNFVSSGGGRVSGSYDAIAFGDISLVLAGMSTTSLEAVNKKNPIFKYLVPVAFLLGLAASILSGTRGTWAAIPILLVILFVYMGKYIHKLKRLLLVGVCGAIILGSYWIPATHVAQRVDSAISEVSGYLNGDVQYGGATVRLLGFRAAMEIYSVNPIIGAGPGNYQREVEIMIKRGRLHEMTAKHFLPSSIFLSTLSTCGTLGFLALLGIFITPIYFSIQLIRSHAEYRSVGYSLMMLVSGFLLFGASEIIFRRSVFASFYILLMAVFMAMAANIRESLTASGAVADQAP
jgi:O-antigen ligase